MTRQIKFRAWDKIDNMLLDCVEINFHKQWVALVYDNGEGGELQQRKFEDVEIMQFTGLLDKNGKEIYEGDILQRPDHGYSSYRREYTVAWSDTASAFIVEKDGSYMSHLPQFMAGERSATNDKELKEIIGNIYTTPNLLTSEVN